MDEENITTTEQPIGTKEIDAVSYTHLDVYKRQALTKTIKQINIILCVKMD